MAPAPLAAWSDGRIIEKDQPTATRSGCGCTWTTGPTTCPASTTSSGCARPTATPPSARTPWPPTATTRCSSCSSSGSRTARCRSSSPTSPRSATCSSCAGRSVAGSSGTRSPASCASSAAPGSCLLSPWPARHAGSGAPTCCASPRWAARPTSSPTPPSSSATARRSRSRVPTSATGRPAPFTTEELAPLLRASTSATSAARPASRRTPRTCSSHAASTRGHPRRALRPDGRLRPPGSTADVAAGPGAHDVSTRAATRQSIPPDRTPGSNGTARRAGETGNSGATSIRGEMVAPLPSSLQRRHDRACYGSGRSGGQGSPESQVLSDHSLPAAPAWNDVTGP